MVGDGEWGVVGWLGMDVVGADEEDWGVGRVKDSWGCGRYRGLGWCGVVLWGRRKRWGCGCCGDGGRVWVGVGV